MKHILFVILTFLPCLGFSQQFLWSTTKLNTAPGNEVQIISLVAVTQKVLDYHEFYEYYYDLTGFSKSGFEQFLKKNSSAAGLIHWDSTMMTDEPTAFAFKGNEGRGSMIVVMLIQKDNIDIISFSNQHDPTGALPSRSYEIGKFKKWFTSFWHPENKGIPSGDGQVSHDYETVGNLVNRKYIIAPRIDDKGLVSGRIAVEFKVDRQGKVFYTRAGAKGTTISDSELFLKCERALLEARLNADENAPQYQSGILIFNFKTR